MDAVPSALSRSLQCLVPFRWGAVAVWIRLDGWESNWKGFCLHVFVFQQKG